MARITGVEKDSAGLFTRFVYWMTRRKIGKVVLPVKITAHQPRLLRAMVKMEMGQAAVHSVDPALKTLASLKTAMLIGCPFWIDIGSAVGRKLKLAENKLMALPDFESSPYLSETEKLVLTYAVAMTQTPVDVSDELFDRLKRVFDARQLVELTSEIAWENYRARFYHAFGIEAEGFSKGAFCPLPERRPDSATRVSNSRLWDPGCPHQLAKQNPELLSTCYTLHWHPVFPRGRPELIP